MSLPKLKDVESIKAEMEGGIREITEDFDDFMKLVTDPKDRLKMQALVSNMRGALRTFFGELAACALIVEKYQKEK